MKIVLKIYGKSTAFFFLFLNGVLSSSYCYLPPHTMAVAFSVPSRKFLNKL